MKKSSSKPSIFRWLIAIGSILFVLVLLTYVLMQSKGGVAPGVSKVHFAGAQKISESSKLHMTFPDKMDKESVVESIETSDELEGEVSWEGNTLIFDPDKKLEEGKTYTFRVDRDAKYASGAPLNKDMEYSFTVAGPPKLSSHFPVNLATDIETDTKIHLVFDRPIVPLSAVQGAGAKKYNGDWPVKLEPQVNGTWRWLGTTTVEFRSADPLSLATKYTVKVPSGIVSVIGDKTTEDFSFTFETLRPKVVHSDPYMDDQFNGPKTEVVLTFNQEMDLEKAKKSVVLVQVDQEKDSKINLDFGLRYGTDLVDEKEIMTKKKIVVTPAQPLMLDSKYELTVKKGIKGLKGDLGSSEDYLLTFYTAGEFKVEETDFRARSVRLTFSNPVNDDTLSGNIQIIPELEDWDDSELATSRWSEHRDLYIYAPFKPSTEYTIALNDKILDQFDQYLVGDTHFTFTTPPLNPEVDILSNGDFGIFEDKHPPVYPFEVVNVSELNLEVARIPFEKFLEIRNREKTVPNYSPHLQDYIGYKALTLQPKNKLDTWETMHMEVEKELGKQLISGIYGMSVQAPEYIREYDKSPIVQYQYFSLTNHAITLKYSAKKALVWVVDMQTGKPVSEADIRFYNLNGDQVIKGLTDAEGFFETAVDLKDFQTIHNDWDPEFWVTASKDGDFTFLGSNWNQGMQPWNFDINSDFRGPIQAEHVLDAYIYTERQAYRPGHTVYFKGITRLRDKSGVITIPDNSYDIHVVVHDAQYNDIYERTFKPNSYGSFSGEFPIDQEAPLGRYGIEVSLIPDSKVERNYTSHDFYVLEYRKPEYKVEVAPEAEHYFSGDTLKFTISGNYYFGAPMTEADVAWVVTSQDYWFNRYTDGWYSFTLEDNWCWWYCEPTTERVTEGEGKLDKAGNLEIEFPFDLDDKGTSQIITVEADITDPNNQVVSNRESVPVHRAEVYVGVRSENYAVQPGEEASIKVVTVDPDGTPIPGQRVTLNLYSREWNTIKKKSVDGAYYYENEPKDTFVKKTSVTTNDDGKAIGKILIKEGGSYRIVAEASDRKGREAKAGTSLYAFSQTYINWPHSNNDRIEVVADKPEYKIGETAKLLIKSPYQGEGVKALITVEKENILLKKVINIESNAQPVEIDITEDLIPNAYVSAVIIKPRDSETFDEEGRDSGMPKFKIGYVKLKVETAPKEMQVKVKTDKQKYGPGETVTVELLTTDFEGNPIRSEVSLGVVDLSVQALLGFKMPDLIEVFYNSRGLGVKTSQMLTYLIEAFKPGSKGGGGGDAESKMRSDFKDTAYWNPGILTDENGKATVSFTLPDNLTTWQLLAIAQSMDHTYGAGVREVIETKKTIVRPLRPRFAVEGDQIKLGATIHNFTDNKQNFTVTLAGEGFTSEGNMEQKVSIDSEDMKTLSFPIKVDRTEELALHFKAEGQGAVDEIEEKIPVYEFGTQQAVATTGWTEENVMEQLYIPSEKEARNGTFTAKLSPTIATYLPDGLEYLIKYPYGCAEQITSRFLMSVALKSLQNFDAFKIVSDEKLENIIVGTLESLYQFQRGDGGFGYWSGSGRSYPYLTAYIIYALDLTRDAGYKVDQSVIDRANRYLAGVLRSQDMEDELSLATRAYILFVMAETGNRDISMANNLYEKRDQLPLFAKAHLAMTYDKSNDKGTRILSEILNEVKIDSRGAHFEEKDRGYWRGVMNTNSKTTALTLQAMVRLIPDHDLLPKVTRYLLAIREEGRWDTTQSTVASLLAFIEFLKSTGELEGNYHAAVSVDQKEILSQNFNQDNILTQAEIVKVFEELPRETYTDVLVKKEGQGRLYYDLVLDYFLTLDYLPPTDQGIGLTRVTTSLDEDEKGFHTTGTYKTKLTITVPEERHFVAISSPLPAGLEPIDFTLATSQRRLAEEVNQDQNEGYWWNKLWYFNHIEFRDDEVFLFADYLPAGVYEYEYLTRATTPGKYKQRPARAWEMYFPETFGQTEGDFLTVEEE